MKVISSLNVKLPTIEFGVTLCKHNAGIGAVERIIGSIKNTFSKFVHQLKMHDEKLLTWIHLVIDKINNRPLILGPPCTFSFILVNIRNYSADIRHH